MQVDRKIIERLLKATEPFETAGKEWNEWSGKSAVIRADVDDCVAIRKAAARLRAALAEGGTDG